MEKSVYNSSVEDDHSYNTYESQHPNPTFDYSSPVEYHKSPARFENSYAKPSQYDLAFKNQGFKDTSTFASNSNYQSQAGSVQDEASISDETPIIQPYASNTLPVYAPTDYYNTDTLPLRDFEEEEEKRAYNPQYSRERPVGLMEELKSRMPPTRKQSPTYSDQLAQIAYHPEHNIVGLAHPHSAPELEPKPRPRAKSEALLETNFEFAPEQEDYPHPLGESTKWKSQPLETAM